MSAVAEEIRRRSMASCGATLLVRKPLVLVALFARTPGSGVIFVLWHVEINEQEEDGRFRSWSGKS